MQGLVSSRINKSNFCRASSVSFGNYSTEADANGAASFTYLLHIILSVSLVLSPEMRVNVFLCFFND